MREWSQDHHDMNTRARKGEKAPCSKESEAEDGVRPRTPIAVRKAQGIRKITLRAKIVKVGTGSLNHEEKSPVSKMMISLNLGYAPRLIRSRLESVATSFSSRARGASNHEGKKPLTSSLETPGRRVIGRISKNGSLFVANIIQRKDQIVHSSPKTSEADSFWALKKEKSNPTSVDQTPFEKRNQTSFASFITKKWAYTDECNHLRKQIEDMLKAGKLSHIIRELKQNSGKEQPKKKGETSKKEKPQAILMIQSRQNAVRQKITQSFSPYLKISFPSLGNDEGAEAPLIKSRERGAPRFHFLFAVLFAVLLSAPDYVDSFPAFEQIFNLLRRWMHSCCIMPHFFVKLAKLFLRFAFHWVVIQEVGF
ncbi:hypothetical protein Tco_0610857 [Tanacetum coccineum]